MYARGKAHQLVNVHAVQGVPVDARAVRGELEGRQRGRHARPVGRWEPGPFRVQLPGRAGAVRVVL